MAEPDPVTPPDAAEAAYREALLANDTGREQRRQRLMAMLPRPDAVAVPVSRAELAWRWRPYALGVLAAGLLLAVVLAWKGLQSGPKTEHRPDARMAAAQPAAPASASSEATVLAQASPPAAPKAAAPASPRNVAKATRQKPGPEVLADAGLARQSGEREEVASARMESSQPAAAAPAAPVVAASPAPAAKAVVEPAPSQAQALAWADAGSNLSGALAERRARSVAGLDAAEPAAASAITAANASLLSAVSQGDVAAARAALQAGASVNARDPHGRTALMLAARAGSREAATLLLSAGARKADRDARGWTAADHAQDQGHGDLAERLR